MSGILDNFIAAGLIHVFKNGVWNLRILGCHIFGRTDDLRISFSALLRISKGDQYLLVKNLHRPELCAPFGGVVKYFEEASAQLDSLSFRPQTQSSLDDMEKDLRGFLPRKYVHKLFRWYKKGVNVESSRQCLVRELKEELKEINLNISVPKAIRFRKVRTVFEGPEKIAGHHHSQFRILDIFEIIPGSNGADRFIDRLINAAESNEGLIVVSANEIETGRSTDNSIIGHHAVYLFKTKRVRQDFPALVSTT